LGVQVVGFAVASPGGTVRPVHLEDARPDRPTDPIPDSKASGFHESDRQGGRLDHHPRSGSRLKPPSTRVLVLTAPRQPNTCRSYTGVLGRLLGQLDADRPPSK